MTLEGTIPEATAQPCNDCPWRRESSPGWLGPFNAEQWVAIAHSDEPIACHKTIVMSGSWDGALQCRGAAIFRDNVMKLPRDPQVAVGPVDKDRVFASNTEFLEHHSRG